jgi:flagellar protein FliS
LHRTCFSFPYNVYKNQDIETSNPRELVSKLYSAAIVSIKRSVIAIREKQIESANNDIIKAEKIISALDGSLDMDYDVSSQLHELYLYMLKRLAEANTKKNTEILNEISGLLTELRDTWDEAKKAGNKLNTKGAALNA